MCSPCGYVANSIERFPWWRKADAGGAAVALAGENRIIPYCLFFGLLNFTFSPFFSAVFKERRQGHVPLPGHGICRNLGRQFAHFALPVEFDELVQNAAHFKPVALNAFVNLFQLG